MSDLGSRIRDAVQQAVRAGTHSTNVVRDVNIAAATGEDAAVSSEQHVVITQRDGKTVEHRVEHTVRRDHGAHTRDER